MLKSVCCWPDPAILSVPVRDFPGSENEQIKRRTSQVHFILARLMVFFFEVFL